MREYRTSVAASSVSSSFPRFLWSAAPCSPARGGGGGEQGFFSHGPAGGGRERGKVSKQGRREREKNGERARLLLAVGEREEGGKKKRKKHVYGEQAERTGEWVSERACVCLCVGGGERWRWWRRRRKVWGRRREGEGEGAGRNWAATSSCGRLHNRRHLVLTASLHFLFFRLCANRECCVILLLTQCSLALSVLLPVSLLSFTEAQ